MTGFVDAHCHPLFAGRELAGSILSECKTTSHLVSTIREYQNEKQLPWLDLSAIEHMPDLNRYVLDEAVTDVPLVVHTADHHSICVNSKALEVAGFSSSAPKLTSGRFDVVNAEPNGWVHEYEAMQLIYEHQPKPSLDDDLSALRAAHRILNGYSITEVIDAWIDPGMAEVYLAAAERKELVVKTHLCFRVTPENAGELLNYAIETRAKTRAVDSESLTADRVKIFLDGVFSSGTAWLKADASTKGIWQPENLVETASKATQAGFKLHFHACGDAAVAQAAEVVARVGARGAVIAHADLIDNADLKQIKELGITVNSTPVWAKDSPDNHFDYRSILDAGIPLTFGSDWPVSEPNPLENIRAAVDLRNLTEAEAMKAARMLV